MHKKLLNEMHQQCSSVDIEYARCCIFANLKNTTTAHYNLLLKKKQILGESLSDFSQLDVLNADADLQVEINKKKH